MTPEELQRASQDVLEEAAGRLGGILAELAARLRPFPPFWGMRSLQAVELEPGVAVAKDHGCVVVTPEGRICQLELSAIPGAPGGVAVDQVEEFRELDLTAQEYIIYAAAAIRQLREELEKRGS